MQWFYDLKTIHKMFVLITVMAIGLVLVGFTGYYIILIKKLVVLLLICTRIELSR